MPGQTVPTPETTATDAPMASADPRPTVEPVAPESEASQRGTGQENEGSSEAATPNEGAVAAVAATMLGI